MNNHFLQTDKGSLFYLQEGSGEALLFLHGNNEDSSIFQEQYNFFTPNFSVFALDTRGHGRSDLGVENLTFQQISEDILLLMKKNKIERVNIIGYSDGGNIGLYFASHFPDHVASLITLGANYEAEALVEPLYRELLEERKSLRKIVDKEERQRRQCILELMLDQLNLTEQDLRNISVPVLVMAGDHDLIKREHTEKMAEIIPNAELFFVPDGGHDFFVANPASLKEAAMVFYQQLAQ